MPFIVKKLVPVFKENDKVPKRWKNLKKAVYVTTFKKIYPNIKEILIKEYGLKPEDKIVIFYMKEINLPHFKRYRTRFKKVWSGRVEGFV